MANLGGFNTKQGYGFGASVGFGFTTTGEADICIVSIGTLGNKRGYIKGVMGEITPNASYKGLEAYEYTWDIVTGEFITSFGDTGDDEIANVEWLIVTHPNRPDKNSSYWNTTDTQYDFIDLDLAQWVGSDLTRSCFNVALKLDEVMYFNFSETYVGTGA